MDYKICIPGDGFACDWNSVKGEITFGDIADAALFDIDAAIDLQSRTGCAILDENDHLLTCDEILEAHRDNDPHCTCNDCIDWCYRVSADNYSAYCND